MKFIQNLHLNTKAFNSVTSHLYHSLKVFRSTAASKDVKPVKRRSFIGLLARAGFTLIELLVVITIISVLIGIVIPALSKSRQNAQQLLCSSGMRQTAMLTLVYADENRQYLPHATNYTTDPTKAHLTWSQVIGQTDPAGRLRRCPGTFNTYFNWTSKNFAQATAAEVQSLRYHAPNVNYMTRSDQWTSTPFKRLSNIRKNLDKLMLAVDMGGTDANAIQRFAGGWIPAEGPRFRHASGDITNLSFLDGRAESWSQSKVVEAYNGYYLTLPRVFTGRLLLHDSITTYYPWGDTLE